MNIYQPTITGSLVISGSVSASGNVSAQTDLQSNYSVGDEGGQIFLNKSVTNTTINTGVNIDINQNRLRFFEQGGSARGGFLDITTLGAGVSTNLQKSSNFFYDAYLINDQTTAAGAATTINNISLPTNAGEAWSFEFNTIGQCSGTSGVRFTVLYTNAPVSSSVFYQGNINTISNFTSTSSVATTPGTSNSMWGITATDLNAIIRGCFVNGASANTVTLRITPVSGTQTATLRAMSYFTARRIS